MYIGLFSRFSDLLRTGQSRDRIRVGASFPTPVQTGPEGHSAFCTLGTGSLSRGYSRWGVALAIHLDLVLRLKEGYGYTCTHPLFRHGAL